MKKTHPAACDGDDIDIKSIMPPVTSQELPLNIYVVIFGTGIFVFVLTVIFCCFFISKLRHEARNVRDGYRMVVFKDDTTTLHSDGLTCAVCLEDFRTKDELGVLPCQHAFHKRCLVKWLEVRCACPMCNNPISAALSQTRGPENLLDELL